MADDQTNPYTQMGMLQMMQPNKYINPAYKDQPLPIPGYMGTPTDAQGNPIQSYTDAQAAHDAWRPPAAAAPAQGTTLNSSPLTQATGPGGLNQMGLNPNAYGLGLQSGQSPMNPSGNAALFAANWGGMMPTSGQWGGAGQRQTAPAAPAPTNPVDMRQAYLTALSNPGKVTTPGATVPQAQPLGQPSVMNAFLAANPGGGGAGAGNYNNAGFFNTLNKLRSA